MIDLETETPATLEQIRHHRLLAAKGRDGKPPTFSMLQRWATTGIKGIVLETICYAGPMATTEQALIRFFERLSMPKGTEKERTPTQARKGHLRAEAMLRNAGVIK